MTAPQNVDILILTVNRCQVLKRCIEKIRNQRYPTRAIALTVFDDASTDETKNEIPRYLRTIQGEFRQTLFLRSESNHGVSRARNELIKNISVDAQICIFVDDDAYLGEDTIEVLTEYLQKHSDTGIVGPRIVLAREPGESILGAHYVSRWTGRFLIKDSREPVDCDWIDPLCIALPVQLVKASGGFPEKFYRSYEGVDFCFTIHEMGYRVVYNPLTTVAHDTVQTYPSHERLYYLYRNKILFVKRHFGLLQQLSTVSFIMFFGLPKFYFKSLLFHRKLVVAEFVLITRAILDALRGKTGRYQERGA